VVVDAEISRMMAPLPAFVIALGFIGIAVAQAATPPAPEAPQLHIYSCQVVSGGAILPKSDEIGLAVRFENDSPQVLSSIVWRANYGTHPVDFIDDGTFSPSVRIDNYLLFERGSSRFNWLGAVGDLVGLAVGVDMRQPLTITNLSFPTYAGTENPEN